MTHQSYHKWVLFTMNDLLNCGKIINKLLEFLPFDLRPVAVPKDKIRIFIFTDNLAKFVFPDPEVCCSFLHGKGISFPRWNCDCCGHVIHPRYHRTSMPGTWCHRGGGTDPEHLRGFGQLHLSCPG